VDARVPAVAGAQGRAVLISSHLMSELQDTADHLVIVGRGKVIADTSVAGLLAAASVTGSRCARPRRRRRWRAEQAGAAVTATDPGTLTVSALTAEKIVAVLATAAVPFSEISAHRASLEEAYLELTRDAVEFRATLGQEITR